MMCGTAACVLKTHSLVTAAQYGNLPLHDAVLDQASEAVVAALLAAHPGAAEEKDKVRPSLLHTTCCNDV